MQLVEKNITRISEQSDNTQFAWIGNIPQHWKIVRGSFVFKVINERSKKGEELLLTVSEHYGVRPRSELNVNMFMAESYVGYKLCSPGDLVINSLWAWSRGLGFSRYHGIVSTAYSVYRSNFEEYDSDYLNYLLRTDRYVVQYLIYSKGIWISRLQLSDWSFLRIPILSPPKEEQIAIAKFLDSKLAKIDKAIAQKEKIIELLKERKQIMIQNAVTKGLDPEVKMKDSGVEWIGLIPETWHVRKLRYLGKTQNGISAGAEYFGSGYPFLSYTDVYNNNQLPSEVEGLANSSVSDRILYSVCENDVFFTRTSETIEEVGYSSVCFNTIENGTFSGFLIRFRPYKNDLYKGYSKYYFSSFIQRSFFTKEINIVTRASLSQELLKRMPVLLPPYDEQIRIYEYLENSVNIINRSVKILKEQIEKLLEYKVILIDNLVTGKLKVV